jgi:hypothetical protein
MGTDDLSPDPRVPAGDNALSPNQDRAMSSKAGGHSAAGRIGLGIHPGVPFDEYLGWDCVSKSRLDDLAISPAYCRMRVLRPDDSTKAQAFGKACHVAVLEPERFEASYALAPGAKRNTKAGKEEWADFLLEAGTREPLRPEEYERCLRIRDAVLGHSRASAIIARSTMREACIVWLDARTGLTCKARADVLAPGLVADLKVTREWHPDHFAAAARKYGIHRQAAMYLAGLRALGQQADHFAVIAVNPEEPHECEVNDFGGMSLECGDVQVRALLDRYAACVRSGVWPAGREEVQSVELPEWYLRRELPDYFQ